MIKSEINDAIFREMEEIIQEKIREFGKINLFVEVKDGQHIHLVPLMKHLKSQISNDEHFKKIAVVTNKEWLKNVLIVKDLIMDAEVEAFATCDRIHAISWIAE
jgi:hypothetical protein